LEVQKHTIDTPGRDVLILIQQLFLFPALLTQSLFHF
jgi:hypothetical protein